MKASEPPLLCAIAPCRNPAPGIVVLKGVRGGRRKLTRNICPACIKKIRKHYGIR